MRSSDVQEMMCGHFQQKYDVIQEKIMAIGCMDELLSGLLYVLMVMNKSGVLQPLVTWRCEITPFGCTCM